MICAFSMMLSPRAERGEQQGHAGADVRAGHVGAVQRGGPVTSDAVRVALDDARAHLDQAVHEVHPALEHLLEEQHRALAPGWPGRWRRSSGPRERRARGRPRSSGWPGPKSAARAASGRWQEQPVAFAPRHPRTPASGKGPQEEFDIERDVRPDIDDQLAAGRRGRGQEAADLDVVRPHRVSRRPGLHALDAQEVRADAPRSGRPCG